MTSRRNVILGGAAVGVVAVGGGLLWWRQSGDVGDDRFEITRSEAEWREILTPEEFAVLREEATEESVLALAMLD